MIRLAVFLFGCICVAVPSAFGDWPEFRGPTSDGRVPSTSRERNLPLRWSETENVKWKTAIPHKGWSTPAILEDQIWLTTATADGHDFFVLCLDPESGRIKRYDKLFHCDKPEPLGNNLNCYAAPSPVLEPGRAYVHFGSYGTACLDAKTGEVLWKRDDLPCRHFRGPGSSPILFEDLLILSMDGVDVQYLVALDKKTGKTVWKTDRTADWDDIGPDGKPKNEGDFRKAYSTPLVIEVNGAKQMLNVGAKALYSHDPRTGQELWKIRTGGQAGAARPLFGNGLAFLSTGHGKSDFLAVRCDGKGDVTDTHIVWRTNRNVPKMPSPLLVDGLIYIVSDGGIANCLEAATGKELWKERVGGDFAASPIYADGRIYCCNQEGKATVFKAGKEFQVLAVNTLAAGSMASPAVDGEALYLRSKTHLYKLVAKSKR